MTWGKSLVTLSLDFLMCKKEVTPLTPTESFWRSNCTRGHRWATRHSWHSLVYAAGALGRQGRVRQEGPLISGPSRYANAANADRGTDTTMPGCQGSLSSPQLSYPHRRHFSRSPRAGLSPSTTGPQGGSNRLGGWPQHSLRPVHLLRLAAGAP